MPKIPTEYLDCVFYLYENREDATAGIKFGGSGFLVSVPSSRFPEQIIYTYAVTNWHTACRDGNSVIRLKSRNGGQDILDLGPEDWTFIPNRYDIAACRIHLDSGRNLGTFVPIQKSISRENVVKRRHSIGVGENVFMLGRFIDHDGGQSNQPAARFGNLSVMPAPVRQPNGIVEDSFCLDLHSRTGFSGSPVFVYRTLGGDLDEIATTNDPFSGRGFLKFLGIHWGQFGEDWKIYDTVGQGTDHIIKGMSGMSCVLPAWTVKEVLDIPKFLDERRKEDEMNASYFEKHGRPLMSEHPLISFRHVRKEAEC